MVEPECEIVSTTDFGVHSEAVIACMWLSTLARASMPIRMRR
jgi:hypothetical protein